MTFSPEPAQGSTAWYAWASDVHTACTVTLPGKVNITDAVALAATSASTLASAGTTSGLAADAGHTHRVPDADGSGDITLYTASGTAVKLHVISGSVGASTAPDATTSSKGLVQLAGDLGGTATAPTVPGKLSPTNIVAGTNVTTSVSGNNVTINATGGGSGGISWGVRSGWRYTPPVLGLAANAFSVGTIFCTALQVPTGFTSNSIGIEVTTAGGSGCVTDLGVYTSGTDGFPNALLFDAGTVACSTTGVKTITISQAISAGVVWLAGVVQGTFTGNPQFRVATSSAYPMPLAGFPGGSPVSGFYTGSGPTSGGLPTTFTQTSIQPAAAPIMAIKAT